MVHALCDKVIISRSRSDNKTDGGLILPNSKDRTDRYIVTDIGCDVSKYLPDLKIGDKVIIKKYSSTLADTVVTDDNQVVEYFSVRAGDIICALEV